MVDLATFRTFPRASPGRRSEALVADRDEPVEKGIPTDEALATRFTQELRAKRRAARTDMRESELWAEPAVVEPPAPPSPPAVDLVPAPTHPGHVEEFHEAPTLHEESPVAAPSTAHEMAEEFVPEPPRLEHEPDILDAEPAASERHYEAVPEEPPALHEPAPEFIPEALAIHEEPAAPIPEASFLDPEPAITPHPMPVDEVSDLASPPETFASDVGVSIESYEPIAVPYEASAAGDPWPAEPPSILDDGETRPIAPPKPFEPDIDAPIAAAPEGEAAEMPPSEAVAPASTLRDYYGRESITLDYRLLGLANPLVCTVTGALGGAAPMELTIGRTGIYRPEGFRPAPWSGFAYDVSPDGRTGFVAGTRVLTARGEIPVEDLVPGDTALALRGPALIPIVWIGRAIAITPPVEIAAHAFGPGRPGKTLRVGADHPVFMQSMPVLARDLVNGDTIRTIETDAAELFHIDVGFAEVLLVEGVPLSSGCR